MMYSVICYFNFIVSDVRTGMMPGENMGTSWSIKVGLKRVKLLTEKFRRIFIFIVDHPKWNKINLLVQTLYLYWCKTMILTDDCLAPEALPACSPMKSKTCHPNVNHQTTRDLSFTPPRGPQIQNPLSLPLIKHIVKNRFR